ncbi:ADP-ribosylglycohydrolase family protein [Cellulomonas sp. S1-8]|uniref:ADP-ribosylglycohydrolase family protein n=1 Tax=Cellulomonas sp. S1-8 TaxID=2904790 RepID=UPI0022441777|nr:ADP-ribosylglycohydrolase family protein [Cellulomonas sp. S1-8]UZN03032.1 ADP-ribosylglycohydrolase family protein [Cellulomonas sp. S1-8]
MTLTPAQLDRAVGAVLGSAAGDALGAGYEFGPPLPDDQPVHMAGGGSFDWAPGEWTDDTSMAVPIARVLADGGALEDEASLDAVVAAWAGWARTAKDVGVQTRALLSSLPTLTASAARDAAAAHFAADPRGAAGNGSLMRTGPVALGYLDDGREDALARAARAVSDLTHADPDTGDACVLWSLTVRHAVRGGALDLGGQLDALPAQRRDVWAARIAEAEASQPSDFDKNGWVVHALQGAWSAIHHGDGLVDVLERSVRGGRDTDTVAAIAGAVAGAVHGAGAVPDAWRRILHGWPGLDADGLGDLARRAATREPVAG